MIILLLIPFTLAQINVSSPQAREIYEKARQDEQKAKESATEKKEKKEETKEASKEVKKENVKDEKKEVPKAEIKKDVKEQTKDTKEEPKAAVKTEVKDEAKPEVKAELKPVVKVEEKKVEQKEEKKEEPLATTELPSSFGGNYQSTQTTEAYGTAAPAVKIKDIPQGPQALPAYGADPTSTPPTTYGGNAGEQKINPYIP